MLQVFQRVIPLILYPAIVTGMILIGFGYFWAGIGLIAISSVATIVIGALTVYRNYVLVLSERAKALAAAAALPEDASDEDHLVVLKKLFETYDLDHSGDMSTRELRELLQVSFHDAPRAAISAAMKEAVVFADNDDDFDLGSFIDAFTAATNALRKYLAAHPDQVKIIDGKKESLLTHFHYRQKDTPPKEQPHEVKPADKATTPPKKMPDAEAEAAAMPAGWVAHTDPASGRAYYTNSALGVSSWERPRTEAPAQAPAPLASAPLASTPREEPTANGGVGDVFARAISSILPPTVRDNTDQMI